jgi:hypothetical protein
VTTCTPRSASSALERGARAQYARSVLADAIPTGTADELARRITDAIEKKRPRVIYPTLYGLGWWATNAASWLALAAGPAPQG